MPVLLCASLHGWTVLRGNRQPLNQNALPILRNGALSRMITPQSAVCVLVLVIGLSVIPGAASCAAAPSGDAITIRSHKASHGKPSTLLAKEKSERERYRWLFRQRPESDREEVEASTILDRLDRELKQARRLYRSGEIDNSLVKFRSVIDHLEALIDDSPPAHSLLADLGARFDVFEEVTMRMLGPVEREPGKEMAGRIFHLMEKRRICLRNLTLRKAGVLDFFDVPESLLKEEAETLTQLLQLKQDVTSPGTRDKEEKLKARLNAVRRSLQKSSPHYALVRRGLALTLDEARKNLLADDELILDFNLFRDRMVIGVISAENAVYHQTPVTRSDIAKAVFNLQAKLREFTLGGRSTFMGHAWKEPCRRVFRTLLGTLPPLPAQKTKVFVIPDGPLWYLPMSVLLDAEDRPFGWNRVVSFIPSVDMLQFIRTQSRGSTMQQTAPNLLLFESLPWIAEEALRKSQERTRGKHKRETMSEGERIERLILTNPVYPKPSEIVIDIQKMFKQFDVWVGPTATSDRFLQYRDQARYATVLAAPFAMIDAVAADRQPSFIFSPDRRGQRRFTASRLFAHKMRSKLIVMPIAWVDAADQDAPAGEGPLLLTTALLYGGTPATLLNYSNPDWGTDAPFLNAILSRLAAGDSPGSALATYQRRMPAGLDSSFSGRPPAWCGWILLGAPTY